ncbi:DNA-protecting protein DprA [Nocardia colli]|uniref:DNA-protecting protein DprA n=1 Tax=Nocardia colli TaxID=2545717 RepID=A0A5N0ECL9_9NOCA|nr:DNA-protecting protein DprA [Nocardia colli]
MSAGVDAESVPSPTDDGDIELPVLSAGSCSEAFDLDAYERRLAWVYLSRVVAGPCAALSALIESVGVIEAARAVRECELPQSLRGPTEQRRGTDSAARDLELIERIGGRVVTPDDPEWPAWRLLGLTQLDAGRDRDGAVPLVLWVRGPRSLLESSDRALAVVGARCSTGYGNQVTGEIASDLAAQGWTIVSGAAFGIDGMAHRAALAVGGSTIAVLACGVDRPYPAEHDRLLAEIAETGLVVSEYPPGTTAHKHQFLARNRLVAALADGVLVVEAGLRSGARNTVKWARRLGRPALAVPGPVTSAASVGCHRMIREGEALLVTRAAEVIDEAGPLRLPLPDSAGGPEDSLSGDEALVFAALPKIGSRTPRELAQQSGLTLHAVRAALPALELAEFVGTNEGGWYRKPTTRRHPEDT